MLLAGEKQMTAAQTKEHEEERNIPASGKSGKTEKSQQHTWYIPGTYFLVNNIDSFSFIVLNFYVVTLVYKIRFV